MNTTKCSKCNAILPPGAKFCNLCGGSTTTQETEGVAYQNYDTQNMGPAANAKWQRIMNHVVTLLKKHRFALIIAAALAIVVITVIILSRPDQYIKAEGVVFVRQAGDVVAIIPHKGTKIEIEGDLVDYQTSLDGTKAAVRIRDGADGYLLYMLDERERLIHDGIEDYWLSASGDGIAFTIYERNLSSYEPAELRLFSKGTTKAVTMDFYQGAAATLSPDGQTVAYVTIGGNWRDGNPAYTGMAWDGAAHELGRNMYPLAIADGARLIYLTRQGEQGATFHVQKKYNEDSRIKLGDDPRDVYFNTDLSQVVYESGGRTYVSLGGGERTGLSGRVYYFVMPQGTAGFSAYGRVRVLGIKDFSNTFYVNRDDALVNIDKKHEAQSVARSVDTAYVANDGKTITYLRENNRLFKVNGTKRNAEPLRLTEETSTWFLSTAKGDAVFYVTEDERDDLYELRYQKGDGKSVLVTDGEIDGVSYELYKGEVLFYISDGELFVSSGERGRRVGGFNGDVTSVQAGMFDVVVTVRDGSERAVYRSTDGVAFSEIYSYIP